MSEETRKIAYLGNFKEPWNTESYIANTLESLGHTVVRINEEGTPKLPECDVFLWAKGRVKNFTELQAEAKKRGILTVCWLFDIYWGTPRQHEVHSPMFKADIVCTTDGGHQKEWESIGVNHHVLRQGIYEKEAYIEENRNPEGIVFVGSDVGWNPHRTRLLPFLQETYGPQYRRYGQRGFGDKRGKDLNHLYGMSKIVVGDSYPSPHYWSNRLYETIGRGGFYVHPDTPGLDFEFQPYEHFLPYSSLAELKDIIDYYLEHDEEREKIRRAGFQHCVAHHTYTKRCIELCKIIRTMTTGTPEP